MPFYFFIWLPAMSDTNHFGDLRPRKAKRIERELTPAERAYELAERDKPEILKRAAEIKREHEAALRPLREALRAMREEREAQELSLADIQDRTGMSRSALCRMENDLNGNPTVSTLPRYADALGKRLLITLADK